MVGHLNSATLKITRNTGGTQDSETGVYSGGTEQVVYDGSVTWQDGAGTNASPEKILSLLGVEMKEIDYKLFLEDRTAISRIDIGDSGLLSFQGGNHSIRVIAKRSLDSAVFAKKYGG